MKRIIFLVFLSVNAFAQKTLTYPAAFEGPASDNYFGCTVNDPYRWLEDDTATATKEWLDDELGLSTKVLNKLRNKFDPEKQLLRNSYAEIGTKYKSGQYYFDFRRDVTEESSSLYIKKTLHGEGLKIVDPHDFKRGGKDNVRVTNFKVSEDDRYLAFAISRKGTDWNELHVMSLFPFRNQKDVLTGVKFSEIQWCRSGFFYKTYAAQGNVLKDVLSAPAIWYHRLGTSQAEDKLIYDDKAHPHANVHFEALTPGGGIVVYHSYADGAEVHNRILAFSLTESFSPVVDTLLSTIRDIKLDVIGRFKNKILARTTFSAPNGKLVLLTGKNRIDDFIPAYKEVLQSANIVGDKIVCTYLDAVEYNVIIFDSLGVPQRNLPYPPGSSINVLSNNYNDSEVVFFNHSFLHPPVVFSLDVKQFKLNLVQQTKILYDVNDLVMEKVQFQSKDGTIIPMILAHMKGIKKDGNNPTILYGYGGYGKVMTPFFNSGFISFIQNGGIIALPCLRGGGEYGEEWHKGGSRLNKQNVFDDFVGAATYLFNEHYTTRDKLVLMGGSNGGLLVAAVINQYPDICRVAIAQKGVYDMFRYHLFTVGTDNIWEFGSSKDSVQFANLKHYSPLHNLKSAAYPSVLVITADHDDRAVPLHSYKYVAALQKNNTGPNPILLRVEKNRGHLDYDLETEVYMYSFIYDQLGIRPGKIHSLTY